MAVRNKSGSWQRKLDTQSCQQHGETHLVRLEEPSAVEAVETDCQVNYAAYLVEQKVGRQNVGKGGGPRGIGTEGLGKLDAERKYKSLIDISVCNER